MFSFNKKGERISSTNYWFAGIHISSSASKLEASLMGCEGAYPGASLTLQKSVSFDLPEEIIAAYEDVLESVRIEQDSVSLKRSSPNASLEDSASFFPKTNTSARSARKTLVPQTLTKLSLLRSMIVDIQEEAFSELLADSGVKPQEVVAIALNDPGIWTGPCDWKPRESYYPLSDGSLLATRTGINVIYSFVPADWSPLGHGRAFLSFPYWILLSSSDRGRLILDLGETGRWTYIPPSQTADSWSKTLYREVVPCGALLNLFTRQVTKGESSIDLSGKLSVQGKNSGELLSFWREYQDKACESVNLQQRYYSTSHSGLLNETFYFEALKSAPPRKFSSLDALCTSVHFIAEQIKDSVESNGKQFAAPYDVVLIGAAKQNGLLFSILSTLMKSSEFHKLSEYGFLEDSFDATAVATLGILFAAGIPAALTELHGVKSDALLGRIVPGTSESRNLFLKFASGNSNQR